MNYFLSGSSGELWCEFLLLVSLLLLSPLLLLLFTFLSMLLSLFMLSSLLHDWHFRVL